MSSIDRNKIESDEVQQQQLSQPQQQKASLSTGSAGREQQDNRASAAAGREDSHDVDTVGAQNESLKSNVTSMSAKDGDTQTSGAGGTVDGEVGRPQVQQVVGDGTSVTASAAPAGVNEQDTRNRKHFPAVSARPNPTSASASLPVQAQPVAANLPAPAVVGLPQPATFLNKLVVYETRLKFYIVGGTRDKRRFRVLKVDRTDLRANPGPPEVADDGAWYTRAQIADLLTMIDEGNRALGGLKKTCAAFALLGCVRFLHAYYLLLVTRRRKVGVLPNGHAVYGIDDTAYVYVPHPALRSPPIDAPLEQRYKALFFGMDLTKDFYFSYTYDLTQPMQANMLAFRSRKLKPLWRFAWNDFLCRPLREQLDAAAEVSKERFSTTGNHSDTAAESTQAENPSGSLRADLLVVKRLDETVGTGLWLRPIIHGFFTHREFSVFSHRVSLFLIARRSKFYAGTRFLKRGITDAGNVGNEVESEQIVADGDSTLLECDGSFSRTTRITSWVQMRGSIPLYWSQDSNFRTPKPPIELTRRDPFYSSTIMHFSQVMERWGAPLIILNLVKQVEKRRREKIIGEEFERAIELANSALPPAAQIHVISFDFRRAHKSKTKKLMETMDEISLDVLRRTGFFFCGRPRYANALRRRPGWERGTYIMGYEPKQLAREMQAASDVSARGDASRRSSISNSANMPCLKTALVHAFPFPETGVTELLPDIIQNSNIFATGAPRVQRGILRTNCVDSLDRTNAAEFCVGKVVLAHQLYALGVVESPDLVDFGTDVVDVLIDMYEGMGNQIALQYAGSELVNTIRTYNAGGWANYSRDLFTTVKRYYSNSFTDAEKQDSINLFLGVFVPHRDVRSNGEHLWDIESDHLFHQHTKIPEQHLIYKDAWWKQPLAKFAESLARLSEPSPSNAIVARTAQRVLTSQEHRALWQRRLVYDVIHHPDKFTSFDLFFAATYTQVFHSPTSATIPEIPGNDVRGVPLEPVSSFKLDNASGTPIRRWALRSSNDQSSADDEPYDEGEIVDELGTRSFKLRRAIWREYVESSAVAMDERVASSRKRYEEALFVSRGWTTAAVDTSTEGSQLSVRIAEYAEKSDPASALYTTQATAISDLALYEWSSNLSESRGPGETASWGLDVPQDSVNQYRAYELAGAQAMSWWT